MAVREYPDRVDTLLLSTLVEIATLEGGTAASTGLTPFEDMFIDGSIFDGGSA